MSIRDKTKKAGANIAVYETENVVTAEVVDETQVACENIEICKNSLWLMSNCLSDLIVKSIRNNSTKNIGSHLKSIIALAYGEYTKETVTKMQDIFNNVINDILRFYLPQNLLKNIVIENDNIMDIVHCKRTTIKILNNDFNLLNCDFEKWTFSLHMEKILELNSSNDLTGIVDISVPNDTDENISSDENEEIIKWYKYSGRQAITDNIKSSKYDLYINADGELRTNKPNGCYYDKLKGLSFTFETLDVLIELLEADGFPVSFDDTQSTIKISKES